MGVNWEGRTNAGPCPPDADPFRPPLEHLADWAFACLPMWQRTIGVGPYTLLVAGGVAYLKHDSVVDEFAIEICNWPAEFGLPSD